MFGQNNTIPYILRFMKNMGGEPDFCFRLSRCLKTLCKDDDFIRRLIFKKQGDRVIMETMDFMWLDGPTS